MESDELSTTGGNVTLKQGDSSSHENNRDPELSYANTPGEILRNVQNGSSIYRDDIVRSKTNNKIGMVSEVAGDSDSDSSTDDDDDEDDGEKDNEAGSTQKCNVVNNRNYDDIYVGGTDDDDYKHSPLKADQVRVLWIDESETTESTNDVTVVDRGFLHGDYIAAKSDPTGQIGIVVDVDMNVDLVTHNRIVLKDKPCRDLKRVRDFTVGDHVVLGPWLGRIEDILDNVTVIFDDGSVCKVMKAEPLCLKPVGKNIFEDGHFPYYPGQRVKASSSSVFKNSRWLSGVWKANRLKGTVTKVTVGSVFIYWIASAGYGPGCATTPAEEQNPNNLKLLSCFSHTNWQLGDWCLLSSSPEALPLPLDKGPLQLESHDSGKDEHESTETGYESEAEVNNSHESTENNKLMENTYVAFLKENNEKSKSNLSKEASHETWPLYRKKIRKVVARTDKKARKKLDNFERALLIINTKTKVDVAWQDGTVKRGLDSTSLIPIEIPGDHEFVAEQYVVEKAADDCDEAVEVRHVGVVKSVDAKNRTACVKWLKPVVRADDPKDFDKEEMVSVYELEGHPDYDYCYGDVVVRLSPVLVPQMDSFLSDIEDRALNSSKKSIYGEEMHQGNKNMETGLGGDMSSEFSDLSWVGNITGLKDGDIEVTWADGMISTVGPQAIYVVGRDDDESVAAGSDVSDGAASWETIDDDNMEIVDNGSEEDGTYNASDTTPEIAENSGNNGALSLSFAAFGYMSRIASGIFSRGRHHSDSLDSEIKINNDLQSNELTLNSDPDGKCSSKISTDIEYQFSKLTTDCKKEEQEAADILLEIAGVRYSPKSPDSDVPPSHDELISTFKGFDIVRDPLDHHFLCSEGQNNAARKWLKKVQQDWNILQNNLPDGIYIRAYEDRMDLLRAVIVGAYGTPYQDGIFFFDFHLPPEYPNVPPSAHYHSGGWRINPNLYEDGKVCLSLLNTWTGRGNEVWDPTTSSILQVLVSLQGLVLNSKPYFNEAGYDKQVRTAEGEKNSLSYNENTFLLSCKTMMNLMRKPPKHFEELVIQHFKKRGYYILKACDAYMKGQLIGSLKKDATISGHSNANSNSVGFKLMLAKIVPKLLSALSEIGADCEEFKHLLQS